MSIHTDSDGVSPDILNPVSRLQALQLSPEFSGPVESLSNHDHNDHIALIYEDRADQFDAIVPFIRQGLERGERCMYIVDDLTEAEILKAMRDVAVDVDGALESGALSFHTVEETYLQNGTFEPDEMVEFFRAAVETATEDYDALRVAGEMAWLQVETTTIEDFMEYEAKVNGLFDDGDCIAMCQYDRNAFPPAVVRNIVRTHPHIIYDRTICQNFYHISPEQLFARDTGERDVDRMMGSLLDRAEAKAALERRERCLQTAYQISSDSNLELETKLRALLELGRERFDLDIGFLAEVTGDRLRIVDAVGDHERIQPGMTTDVSAAYCQWVLDADEPVSVADAAAEGFETTYAYELYDLDSYLGTTVTVHGRTYGTFCFASRDSHAKFSDEDHTFVELLGQWIGVELEREQTESRLAALNEMSRGLMNAETTDAIADRAIEHAAVGLMLPVTAILIYDSQAGDLSLEAQTPRAENELPTAALCDRESGPLWEAFVADEVNAITDVADLSGCRSDLAEVVAVPLDRQGLLVSATCGEFRDWEVDFIEATAATVEAAWDRANRERQLHEREQRLEEKNERLERLDRVNDIIRAIDKALVRASNRAEIETVVCEQLADTGPYELAWIGERDAFSDDISVRDAAGSDRGYLDDLTGTDGESKRGPTERAIETRQPVIINDILVDDSIGSWRQAALNRGYHACIALPLEYGDTLYGALTVYAEEPGVFDELEGPVVGEMADTIAYAINAVESKKAIVSDAVTALEFEVDQRALVIVEATRDLDCIFTLETVVPGVDALRIFFSIRGATTDELMAYESRLPVTSMSVITEGEEHGEPWGLYEAELTDDSICATALEHGARPREVTATPDGGTITVELPADASVREFVEMFGTKFPGASLVAQHNRERSSQTPTEFFAGLTEALTPRQLEALRMAYFSGYFDEPRMRSATEIADAMDISQPTFNSHLRAAHGELCRQLFDSGPGRP